MSPLPSAALAALVLLAAPLAARADAPAFSGILQSAAAASAGAGGAEPSSLGFEEYCNLRLKASAGERGTVYAAVNLVAASGSYLPPEEAIALTAFVAGENYAAALELERLYVRITGEALDVEAGLLRAAFGYGQAWRPMDFLAPPNPLLPDARPRGVLGAVVSAYPSRTARVRTFIAAGADPTETDGEGTTLGISADVHGNRVSLQGLYAYRSPDAEYARGLHVAGASVKLEAGAGIVIDALYTLDPSGNLGWGGLKAGLGADYSLFGGDLYILGQYLYNGPGALAPGDDIGDLYDSPTDAWYETAPVDREAAPGVTLAELNRRNYLYAALQYRFDDYTRASLSCAAGLDDASFLPALSMEYEPFQALTLAWSCRLPLDARTFRSYGDYGEFGPANTGSWASLTFTAKLKF